MDFTIIVFSQNLKLKVFSKLKNEIGENSNILFFTTHQLFQNEKEYLKAIFGDCMFLTFADVLTDSDLAFCDKKAFISKDTEVQNFSFKGMDAYYGRIKSIKNQLVVDYLLDQYSITKRIILSDDLGIELQVWLDKGFSYIKYEYYYSPSSDLVVKKKYFERVYDYLKYLIKKDVFVARYGGFKYVFHGKLNRVSYRFNLNFETSLFEKMFDIVNSVIYKFTGNLIHRKVINLTTLHEAVLNGLPDSKDYHLKIIQDGYLPENYSSCYLRFYGENTEFYTWDYIGLLTFRYHGLPARILPFRKKLYLPYPKVPISIKKVLCVTSGSGDWTAIKNRSDEDRMVIAFGQIAAMYPEIEFVYRCHPVWIYPEHQGVNSINRVIEYFACLNLPNLKVSSNIPSAYEKGHLVLSYKRSSFEDDLKDVDLVFGEHSVSMLDAALNQIMFASVNVTGNRDFFKSITDLGFPHCESIDEIVMLLNNSTNNVFMANYVNAIDNYNKMTDREK